METASEPKLYDVTADHILRLNGDFPATVCLGSEDHLSLDGEGTELFRLSCTSGSWHLDPLGPGALSVNGTPAWQQMPLHHLATIQVSPKVLIFVEHDDPVVATRYSAKRWLVSQLGDSSEPGADLEGSSALQETLSQTIDIKQTQQIPLQRLMEESTPLKLPGATRLRQREMLIGRDDRRVDIHLPDVRVSSVHASIRLDGESAVLTDLRSTNGTFVNGEPIRPTGLVSSGSHIQIGPYTLILREGALYPLTHDNNVQLVARGLVRRVPDRSRRGQTKVILDHISLVVQPREFVCILGPSGSGKSTLLSALSARVPADEGSVFLNGEDLYAHFEVLKHNLAVVPQKDVLHDVLPLNVALWYTAKLRLPVDTSSKDIEARVDDTLDTVNLVQRQFTPIRKLSGGQIKRASWANEAICNPSLIFLDEVTSGLDEQTDSEMMQLFRRMADEGKTIVCVTHSLSYVEQNCNLLVILASGGVLAFVGTPSEALEYFGVARLGDIYQRLSERAPLYWKERFEQHRLYQTYVQQRLPNTEANDVKRRRTMRWAHTELIVGWRQFMLLIRRYATIQWADKRTIGMMLGQSLFIAGLLVWLFGDISNLKVQSEAEQLAEAYALVGWDDLFPSDREAYLTEAEEAKRMDRSSKLLFLLCISCIWFGCNNSAKEIIKERTVYSKERDVGLKVPSYYGSKLALLGALTGIQASLLFCVVAYFTQLGGHTLDQWLLLTLSSLAGVAMGLTISAVATSEDVAVSIVPMVLIPQIVMAGLIAPLLNYTREFSQVAIPAYWSYQGLLGSLEEPLQVRLRDGGYLVLGSGWSSEMVCGVLFSYTVVFAAAAIATLYSRDR